MAATSPRVLTSTENLSPLGEAFNILQATLGWIGEAGCHSLERRNPSIGHAQPAVVMTRHGVDTPVFSIVFSLENGSIQWLTNPEHQPLASMDDGTVTHDKFLWQLRLHDLQLKLIERQRMSAITDLRVFH